MSASFDVPLGRVVNRRGNGSTFGDVVRGNGNHQCSAELNAYKRKFSVNVQSHYLKASFLTLQARDIDSNALRNVVQTNAKGSHKANTADLTLHNIRVILIQIHFDRMETGVKIPAQQFVRQQLSSA